MLEKMEAALNKQVNEELFSYYLYQSMSAWFEEKGLKGFAVWMANQAKEEMFHAMRIYDYIHERGGKVELEAIAKPKKNWTGALNIFEEALAHENHITACINDLVTLARSKKDYATEAMLQWFVTEQVEEESNVTEWVDKLTMAKDAAGAMFMLDREAGQRTFAPPTAAA